MILFDCTFSSPEKPLTLLVPTPRPWPLYRSTGPPVSTHWEQLVGQGRDLFFLQDLWTWKPSIGQSLWEAKEIVSSYISLMEEARLYVVQENKANTLREAEMKERRVLAPLAPLVSMVLGPTVSCLLQLWFGWSTSSWFWKTNCPICLSSFEVVFLHL